MSTTKDTISQIKEAEEKAKPTQIINKDEEYLGSDEEDNQKTKGAVEEQAATTSNQPKNLAELLSRDAGDKKVNKKQKVVTEKVQKQQPSSKARFYNSNKQNINNNVSSQSTQQASQKQKFTGKLGEASKQYNDSVKPTKNYLDKELPKSYKDEKEEDVTKPEFKSKGDGNNFVELNKNEDLLARNMAQHNFDFKREYNDDTKKGGEYVEKKKKYSNKKQTYTKEEIVNDVDSDGFEITGTKEKKKENMPKKQKMYKNYNYENKRRYRKKEEKNEEGNAEQPPEGEKIEAPVNKIPETQVAEVDIGGAKSLKELIG